MVYVKFENRQPSRPAASSPCGMTAVLCARYAQKNWVRSLSMGNPACSHAMMPPVMDTTFS